MDASPRPPGHPYPTITFSDLARLSPKDGLGMISLRRMVVKCGVGDPRETKVFGGPIDWVEICKEKANDWEQISAWWKGWGGRLVETEGRTADYLELLVRLQAEQTDLYRTVCLSMYHNRPDFRQDGRQRKLEILRYRLQVAAGHHQMGQGRFIIQEVRGETNRVLLIGWGVNICFSSDRLSVKQVESFLATLYPLDSIQFL